jgi:hypothetical protein
VTLLTLVYIACFQLCALPSLVRIRRRQSSADLSVWREWLLIVGVCAQFAVMLSAGVPWQVWISPVLSLVSVSVLLGHIYWFRADRAEVAR